MDIERNLDINDKTFPKEIVTQLINNLNECSQFNMKTKEDIFVDVVL